MEVIGLSDSLKKTGVYDNTHVILMGDHAAWVPPLVLRGQKLTDPKINAANFPTVVAMAVPLLAI